MDNIKIIDKEGDIDLHSFCIELSENEYKCLESDYVFTAGTTTKVIVFTFVIFIVAFLIGRLTSGN